MLIAFLYTKVHTSPLKNTVQNSETNDMIQYTKYHNNTCTPLLYKHDI